MASASASAPMPPRMPPSPSLGLRPAAASASPYAAKVLGKKARTTWPKMIGSETFIIVALRCTENSTSSALARWICAVRNSLSAPTRIDGGVDDLAGEHLELVLEHRHGAVGGGVLDAQGVVGGDHDGLLVVAEVVGVHRRDVGARVGAPGTHRVRVRPGVVLDRGRGTAIGVALAQDRVDRGALDLVVLRAGRLLLVGLRVLGVGRQVVALVLQLLDRGLELRDRGGHVGQLDDVGLGLGGQLAELGERVVEALVLGQPLGELADDPRRHGDVAGLDLDARGLRVGRDDRQERVRRQHGRFIGVGVDDLGHEYEALLGRGVRETNLMSRYLTDREA